MRPVTDEAAQKIATRVLNTPKAMLADLGDDPETNKLPLPADRIRSMRWFGVNSDDAWRIGMSRKHYMLFLVALKAAEEE